MRPDIHARFARPRNEDDYDDLPRKPKKKKGMSVGMILLIVFGSIGAVSCLVCTGVGIVAYVGYVKAKEALEEGRIPDGKGPVLLSQHGRLFPNDPQRENKPHKAFQVDFQQGKTYVVTLRSNEMDSYLYVYDPAGMKVAEDDDSGGGFNGLDSRVHVTAQRTGKYTVSCSVLGGGMGVRAGGASFTVTVKER